MGPVSWALRKDNRERGTENRRTGNGEQGMGNGERKTAAMVNGGSVPMAAPNVKANRRREKTLLEPAVARLTEHDDVETMHGTIRICRIYSCLTENSSTTTIGDTPNLHIHNKSTYLWTPL